MNIIEQIGLLLYNVLGGLLLTFGTFFAAALFPIVALSILGFLSRAIFKGRLDTSSFEGNFQAYGIIAGLPLLIFAYPLYWLCKKTMADFYSMDLYAFVRTPTFAIVLIIWAMPLVYLILQRFWSSRPNRNP